MKLRPLEKLEFSFENSKHLFIGTSFYGMEYHVPIWLVLIEYVVYNIGDSLSVLSLEVDELLENTDELVKFATTIDFTHHLGYCIESSENVQQKGVYELDDELSRFLYNVKCGLMRKLEYNESLIKAV